jgi:hypothetical protein
MVKKSKPIPSRGEENTYWNVARMLQEEKRFLEGGLRQHNNTMRFLNS